MTTLALHGGDPIIRIPPPHFRWPLIGEDEERAVLDQLRSGVLSVADRSGVIAELEAAFAAHLGLPYVMSSCAGTAALHAAFFALDLAPGDEVLAPAYTHLGTVLPMLHAHLIPVLCDVDAVTGNLDPDDAAARITARTRAIVVTHQYGHVCDMPRIIALARRHGLLVVEDCSHAHGATLDGALAGTFGDIACWSLQAHKAVVAGEGGVLATANPRLFERAALLGHFRRPTDATSAAYAPFVETGYGLKLRLHPLGAALALVQLRKLAATIERRRANHRLLAAELASVPGVALVETSPEVDRGGFFRFILRHDAAAAGGVSRDQFVAAVRAEGAIELMSGGLAKPLHLTALFQTEVDRMTRTGWPRTGAHVARVRTYRAGELPRAERFAATTLQLPAFTEPSGPIIAAYAAAMRKVIAHGAELGAA